MEYNECRECPGYCCMYNEGLGTPLVESDISKISKYLEITEEEFIKHFVRLSKGKVYYEDSPDAIGGIKGISACPFLRQGLCAINKVKPKYCKEYVPVRYGNISCKDYNKARLGWMG